MEAVRYLGALALGAWLCGLPHTASAQTADPLEGVTIGAIRVIGLQRLDPDVVERHLISRAGEPFHRANLAPDRRALDELRLFASVTIEPILEGSTVVVVVTVAETLKLLPTLLMRVTDENGVSAGGGLRGINLFGRGTLTSVGILFGGETSVTAAVEAPTITPGTWRWRAGFRFVNRENVLYSFDERSSTANLRFSRIFPHGFRVGGVVDVLAVDTGGSTAALAADGTDIIPSVGGFATFDTLDSTTNPRQGTWAEVQIEHMGVDAASWTFTLDGRRFQPFTERHGLGVFALATVQTGVVGETLPEYLQFALGGANSVRGWSLGSRQGRNQFIGGLEYAFVAVPVRHFRVKGMNFYGGVQAVAFVDTGLAWNSRTDFDFQSGITGYGIGLRLLVPFVDLVRLDLAWGEPGRGPAFCFGVSLKATRQRQRVR
jgi:outer membrane protein insertion porin family